MERGAAGDVGQVQHLREVGGEVPVEGKWAVLWAGGVRYTFFAGKPIEEQSASGKNRSNDDCSFFCIFVWEIRQNVVSTMVHHRNDSRPPIPTTLSKVVGEKRNRKKCILT